MASSAQRMSTAPAKEFFKKHAQLLARAEQAILDRTYWSAYSEIPSGKIYGETAKADAEAAFKALLNKPFELDQTSTQKLGAENHLTDSRLASPTRPCLSINCSLCLQAPVKIGRMPV